MKIYTFYCLSFFLFVSCSNAEKHLPILGNREPVEKIVDGKTITDTIYQTIPPFSFLNQDSTVITNHNFDGKIYIADFFFTRCPGICPIMHRNMLKVYEKFKDNKDFKILSHTIDDTYDSPYQLKKYANKLGVKGTQWEFVYGLHDSVYTIAEKNYLVAVAKDNEAPGGYIHQGWFILVDKEKRLRGNYDGTEPLEVDRLIEDIQTLLDEYK